MVDPTEEEEDDESPMPTQDDDADDEQDGCCRAIGDVTIPCPVTITDSTSSFIRDMLKGSPKPLLKAPAYCPECGEEMHLCANCASGAVHTRPEYQGTGEP